MCIPASYIVGHDGYRIVERRHNPEKWVNVDMIKEGPNESFVTGMLNWNQPRLDTI